ncbi:MAG TPA: ice-binding family protein [Saprospiraceae bacterium]|nr:ice-binding family protein [Saprospiraceae bacterium]
MKNLKILAALLIVSVVWMAGCQKDNFQDVVGTCPVVLSTNPENGATNVPYNQIISATFNQRMNPETITPVSFTVRGASNISGALSFNGNTVSFTPLELLLPNTTYTARITTQAKDPQGNALQADYVWIFSTDSFFVNLKSVNRFGILAGTGIINAAGQSQIHDMDVAISPGVRSSITGFPPAILVNGAIYASDDILPAGIPAMLTQAKLDLTQAYIFAEGAVSPAPNTVSGDLGGTTLLPGIYKSTSSLLIQNGNLTLNAQGDPNAFWVFQVASNFNTVGGAGGNVILSGGAQAKNVYWQIGSSATIGDFTSFKGTVLALNSVTMNSGATTEGRMLAINGTVVLTNTNVINKP